MEQLSTTTLKILQKNGWTETRTVDIHKYEAFFEETRQETSQLILDFLRRFGDMKIAYTDRQDSKSEDCWCINPIEAMKHMLPEHLASYIHHWIKKPLCVIGFDEHDYTSLAMTPDGETYSFFDKWVVKYGNNPYEALNNMIDVQKPICRVFPPPDLDIAKRL